MDEPRASNWGLARRRAYRWGLILAALAVAVLLWPGQERWHMAGPANTGHEEIACDTCHADADGSAIGQALTNLGYWLGIGDAPAHFVFAPAGNRQCLDCHEHEDDRHPVARFLEPRFETARGRIAPQFCVSCHRQHQGLRVSAPPDFCVNCHRETEVEDDPLDVTHATLIAEGRWDSCLGCHDFHGNHERETPVMLADRRDPAQIRRYFDGGESPYGNRRLTVMQTMRTDAEREANP